jgi:lysozyme family protein
MANFEVAINKVLGFEGGYVNDPLDSGGKTKYGITEYTARMHGYSGKMRDLPLSKAKTIYCYSYWKPLRLDEVTNQKIAENLFDVRVNGGRPVKWAQQTLNNMNVDSRRRKIFKDLVEDGIIGSKTIRELNKIDNGKFWELIFLEIFNYYRVGYYIDITNRNPNQKVFLHGWIKRTIENKR